MLTIRQTIGIILTGPFLFTILDAEPLPCEVSWIGNSFGGGKAWVLQDVEDIYVAPDGSVFTNVDWDEAGGNVEEFKEGQLVRVAYHTHGWGYEGGYVVAGNSKYLFIAQGINNEGGHLKGNSWPVAGKAWSGVSRRLRSDISKPAPFEGGHGREGDVLPSAFLPVVEFPEKQTGHIRGLWASETELFVSCPWERLIKVYDSESMRLLRTWPLERGHKLCLDHQGYLWILQSPDPGQGWQVLCYNTQGDRQPWTIAFPGSVIPTDICADAQDRLLIADSGPDQQIKIYTQIHKQPQFTAAFGTKGGIYSGASGQFGDLKFNQPKGVGVDAQGNLYIASSGSSARTTGGGGSTVLESYTSAGQYRWRVLGLEFIDCACLDPAQETDAYTKEERINLDYTRGPGQEWQYRAYTVNPFKYPDDPRLHIWSANAWLRRLGGQRILFVTDMTGESLQVYRFNPDTDGEIAIPCAMYSRRPQKTKHHWPAHQPEKGSWLWRDRNGNGAFEPGEYTELGQGKGHFIPDTTGNVWSVQSAQIEQWPFNRLDEQGIPQWSKSITYEKPGELDAVRRLRYLPEKDFMLLGGNKGSDRNQHWKPMGPVLCAYQDWSQERKLRWQQVLPYTKGSQGHESAEPISFVVAGDYVFVAYTRGLKDNKYAFVKILRLQDGAQVGDFVPEHQLGEIGLLDILESVNAQRRSNGEYIIFLEDDYKGKVVMFRWKPKTTGG